MPRTYVDNKMNRQLGRVGLPVGSAVHSRSSSSYQSNSGSQGAYVDNKMNRGLGRVGMEYGTAVHSRSETPKVYVDNKFNQDLGRVGKPHGTAVHSKSETPKVYVDNKFNQDLGRVGKPHGTAVHSKSETPKVYVDNKFNQDLGRVGKPHGTAVHSKSETPKVYVDNKFNQDLGRVGKPHGAAVHSKSDSGSEKHKTCMDSVVNQLQTHLVAQHSHSSVQPEMKVYVDNAFNRKHGRAGLPLGSVPISRKSQLYRDSRLNSKQEETSAVKVNEKLCFTPEKKVYVDNAFNRKHNRVGLPLGSVPISRKIEVYSDTPINRRQSRVGKPWGTALASENKLAALHRHLEEHSDEDIPEEFDDMSEDDFTYVLEYRQREQAVTKFLEETPNNNWQPHEHTLTETIKKYKGKIIDFKTLQLGPAVGHGGFGQVYFASLESGEAVAVKKLKCQQLTKKRLQLFTNEMDLFLQLDHPNIVSFIGACIEVPDLAIVMEYMDMSMFDAIHVKAVDFTVNNKLEITTGVTNGMAYLHYQDIAHCDLKTKNVLLINVPGENLTDSSEQVRAKITDFGLSKMQSDMLTSSSFSGKHIGTPLYSAPEIHQGKTLSLEDMKKADMFSLGLLIWELAVEDIPFADLSYEQLRVQVGEKGLTPIEPEHLRLDRKVQETLSLCWSMDPDKRPSAENMAEIAGTFTNLLEEGEE